MRLLLPSTFAVAVALSGCGGSSGAGVPPQQIAVTKSAQRVLRTPLGASSILPGTTATTVQATLCKRPADPQHAGCFATLRPDSVISSIFPDAVNGLTPNDLSSLYAYPAPGMQGSAGFGQTVAVAVAGNYALAESDLAVYRAHFGLPPCTSANGCLTKVGAAATNIVSQTGTSTSISAHPTSANAIGWAAETDIDTETISAVCPNCKIMLAQAASDSLADLGVAVSDAAYAGASIVNASFGAPESAADLQFSWAYANIRNVKVVAAAGDWGFGVYYPASDSNVIAVGGTTLSFNGMWASETAWNGTGSGCSKWFNNPGWQQVPYVSNSCTKRNVADVAAVADPGTGVAIYDSSLFGLTGGWSILGGTSVAAPIITGMYALSGDTQRGKGAQSLYGAYPFSFYQVTSGSNGTCNPQYLCTAMPGYNGPTGIGIPHGLGGF